MNDRYSTIPRLVDWCNATLWSFWMNWRHGASEDIYQPTDNANHCYYYGDLDYHFITSLLDKEKGRWQKSPENASAQPNITQ